MAEYIGIIEMTEKKKKGNCKKQVVSFEGTAKTLAKARRLFSVAALDMATGSETVELLAISRLKKGKPVNHEVMAFKPEVTVFLSEDYDIKSVDGTEFKMTVPDTKSKDAGSVVAKPKAKKRPNFKTIMSKECMLDICNNGILYQYDYDNYAEEVEL